MLLVRLHVYRSNKPKTYKIFENSDADLSWLLFKEANLLQNELMVICDWLKKKMPMSIRRAPTAIFACTFMKTL